MLSLLSLAPVVPRRTQIPDVLALHGSQKGHAKGGGAHSEMQSPCRWGPCGQLPFILTSSNCVVSKEVTRIRIVRGFGREGEAYACAE